MIAPGALPPGGERLVRQRLAGRDPADMVVVSFLGYLPQDFARNTHLLARPGQAYDWRILAGLSLCLLVRPGLPGIARSMRDICAAARAATVMAWDVERGVGADLWLLPDCATLQLARSRWRWSLEVLPWLPFQNRQFLSAACD